jgi:hypothetical protein
LDRLSTSEYAAKDEAEAAAAENVVVVDDDDGDDAEEEENAEVDDNDDDEEETATTEQDCCERKSFADIGINFSTFAFKKNKKSRNSNSAAGCMRPLKTALSY